jgi:hypothetical protein
MKQHLHHPRDLILRWDLSSAESCESVDEFVQQWFLVLISSTLNPCVRVRRFGEADDPPCFAFGAFIYDPAWWWFGWFACRLKVVRVGVSMFG